MDSQKSVEAAKINPKAYNPKQTIRTIQFKLNPQKY